MSQSCFSLGFLFQNSLWKFSTFVGIRGIYTGVRKECEESFFHNRVVWRLSLATWLSRESKTPTNWKTKLDFLSCSAPAGTTLTFSACLAHVQLLVACKPRATREIQSWVPISLHNLEHFFTLSHSLPLHESHLNTGLLIAKIQENLTRNKTNKMVDRIQPYKIQ